MSTADDLRAARECAERVSMRMRRHLDGRRATLPPAAVPFDSARRLLASVPVREYPTCASCGAGIKCNGVVEDDGQWVHETCRERELARGAR